jgi:hypothetical protein
MVKQIGGMNCLEFVDQKIDEGYSEDSAWLEWNALTMDDEEFFDCYGSGEE